MFYSLYCITYLHYGRLSALRDSAQLYSALSQTALSLTQRCPEQRSALHRYLPNSFKLDSDYPGLLVKEKCKYLGEFA